MLTLYLELFFVFFKIGLFSFGGGIAMLPVIEREILARSWLTSSEFIKIVGVSQITPGPISINAASFVGLRVGGLIGSVVSTVALSLPSVIIMIMISSFLIRVQSHPIKINIFRGVKSVSIVLIIYAAYSIGVDAFLVEGDIQTIAVALFALALFCLRKTSIHPLIIIISSGIFGFFLL